MTHGIVLLLPWQVWVICWYGFFCGFFYRLATLFFFKKKSWPDEAVEFCILMLIWGERAMTWRDTYGRLPEKSCHTVEAERVLVGACSRRRCSAWRPMLGAWVQRCKGARHLRYCFSMYTQSRFHAFWAERRFTQCSNLLFPPSWNIRDSGYESRQQRVRVLACTKVPIVGWSSYTNA